MREFEGYIGLFDSGVGGISVLKELTRELPHEKFLFFGDSANAPYGDKGAAQVLQLSKHIAEDMIDEGCKAIVIACNTATSVAAEDLRSKWHKVPIIGIEPALKPAARAFDNRRILVMATSNTLRLEKFNDLARHWGSNAEIISLACPGLVDLIETGKLDSDELYAHVQSLLEPYKGNVDAVVLGCTHYPFVKRQIRMVLGDVPFFDGAEGTARQLRRKLEEHGLLAPTTQQGTVVFRSSLAGKEELRLYERFLRESTD